MAHGGIAGALVEALIALAVVAVILAVWLRERRVSHDVEDSECLTDGESRHS